MYKLMIYRNKKWEQRGVYETYLEAFRAGLNGTGYAQFNIEEVEK